MTPVDTNTNEAIQALQSQFLRGDISEDAYEQGLRKILNPLQHRPHPGKEPQQSSRDHIRFAESSISMPQTSGRRLTPPPHYSDAHLLPGTGSANLSFDDLPTELGLDNKSPPRLPANPSVSPMALSVFDPSTWSSDHLLDGRYHIETVLSASEESTVFVALDLLLQERVNIHMASLAVAKTPAHRKRFIRHYGHMKAFAHPQVARMHHIEYRPKQMLLYALVASSPGQTLAQQVHPKAHFLSAACGEALLYNLAMVLALHQQQMGRNLAPTAADVMWQVEDPESALVLLNLRHPGPEQIAAPEFEGYCVANIMLCMLAGSAPLDVPLSQRNPSVTPALQQVIEQATSQSPQDWYTDTTYLYEAYKDALLPKVSPMVVPSAVLRTSQHFTPTPLPAATLTPLPARKASIRAGQNFHAHFSELQAMATDQRGESLLTAGKDRQLKWWETTTWDLLHAETLEKSALTCASLSLCGKWMAYTKSSHRVAIRMADMSDEICLLQHKSPVASLLWQEGASRLLVATKDGHICQWSIPNAKLVVPPPPQTLPLFRIEQDAAAGLLATLHKGGLIKLWSLDTHQWLFDLPDAVSPAGCHSFVPPGPTTTHETLLATGHKDGKVRFWNYETGILEHKLKAHSAPLQLLRFSRNGQWMVSGDKNADVRLWSRKDGLGQFTELNNPTFKPLISCLFVQGERQLVGMVEGSQLVTWTLPAIAAK